MINPEISKILTEGLVGGYAGKGKIEKVNRASFSGKSSHSVPEEGSLYHDEWFVPNYLGGGQEIVKAGEVLFTRLYGGGTPSPEILTSLGISTEEVGSYLKQKIVDLGEETRLDKDCKPEKDGEWQYVYEILLQDPNIPVIVSAESIIYKDTRVHLHPFILSPLK
jgi:hypothetical protein